MQRDYDLAVLCMLETLVFSEEEELYVRLVEAGAHATSFDLCKLPQQRFKAARRSQCL